MSAEEIVIYDGEEASQDPYLGEGSPRQLVAELVEELFHQIVVVLWSFVLGSMRLVLRGELRRYCTVPRADEYEFVHDPAQQDTPAARMLSVVDWLLAVCADHLRVLMGLPQLLLSTFFFGVHFLLIWLLSRRYWRLTPAIPAILLLVAVAGVSVTVTLSSPRDLVSHYQKAAQEAVANDDLATAKLCYDKLEQLRPRNHYSAFTAAELIAQEGNIDEAYQRMQRLANEDGFGYLPAHLWIAYALSTQRISMEPTEAQELIDSHLNHVLRREPRNELALRLLAECQATQGASEAAIATLRQLSPRDVEFGLDRDMQAAEIHLRSGDTAAARRLWAKAASGFGELFDASRSLSPQSFSNWTYAELQVGTRTEAIRVLQRGIEQFPENDELVAAYHQECAALVRASEKTHRFEIEGHLRTLKRLIAEDPDDEEALLQLADAYAIPTVRHEAEGMLEHRLKNDDLPLAVFERLASVWLREGDFEVAERLYRRVLQEDSKRPAVLNNLAWILAHNDSPNCEYALSLIDQAISIDETIPGLHGTRGHILVKLRRWQEAIRELNIAINGDPKYAQLHHEALATAHQHMGQQDLATVYHDQSSYTADIVNDYSLH